MARLSASHDLTAFPQALPERRKRRTVRYPAGCCCSGLSNEFRAIVHSQVGRRLIQLEQLLDRVDRVNGLAAPADTNNHPERSGISTIGYPPPS